MGVNPHLGYYEMQSASNHIGNASPTGDGSAMSFYAYYIEASGDAWSTWEQYSDNGTYAVRVRIPVSPTSYENGIPIYRASVERKRADMPLDQWKRVAFTPIKMPSGIDSDGVRRIYASMDSGLFGLPSSSPSAIASNIAVTTAEVTALSQLAVWKASFEAIIYVIGLSDTLG